MVLAFLFSLTTVQAVQANESGKSGIEPRQRYLLLDQRLISNTENTELKLGTVKRHPANPMLKDELPWEVEGSHMYHSVVFDPQDKLYKCWYYSHWWSNDRKAAEMRKHIKASPKAVVEGQKADRLAYMIATSKDGINWIRPKLDLYLYKGKPTNIIIITDEGFGVTLDKYETDPERRYKAMFQDDWHGRLYTSYSADGIHWSKRKDTKAYVSGDTLNHAYWDPHARQYVAFTRVFSHGDYGIDTNDNIRLPWRPGKKGDKAVVTGQRTVARLTSKDFVNWTEPEIVFQYGHDLRQIYHMPTFYCHGVFLGLPAIYDYNQFYNFAKLDLEKDLGFTRQPVGPELMDELKDAGKSQRIWPGLAWSTDTKDWKWVGQRGEPIIPLSEDKNSVEWGMIFAGYEPLVLDDEIRIYYSAQKMKHDGWWPGWIGLATLRADGWTGYVPKDESKDAVVETKPVVCSGKKMSLAADAEKGSIVVTLTDAKGKTLASSKPLRDSKPYTSVKWKKGFKLSKYRGQQVRLKFTINNAKLYSFKFDK